MKFNCSAQSFQNAFNIVSMASAVKDIKQALQNIYCEATDDGKVILSATNLDTSIKATIGATVFETGSAILPKFLFKKVLSCKDETLSIEERNGKLKIFDGRYKDIPTMNPEEFPTIDYSVGDNYVVLSAMALKKAFNRTSYAIDLASSKYTLNGVFFEFCDDMIDAVATDGCRLAHQSMTIERPEGNSIESNSPSVIIPITAVRIIEKAIDKYEGIIKMSADGGKVYIETENIFIASRLTDGRFPKWRNIIPAKRDNRVIVRNSDIIEAVQQVRFVLSDEGAGIDLSFDTNEITVSASDKNYGNAEMKVACQYVGPKMNMKFCSRFIIECLREMNPESNCVLEIEQDKAIHIYPENENDMNEGVIMPML